MKNNSPKSLPSIGFLTVVEDEQLGLLGGYLVLNAAGRPLEFHCTAPVKANRAQEILYGPTLAPFLYGEQIGQTLLAKARVEPLLVCTDVQPALALREHSSVPVAFVQVGADEGHRSPADGERSAKKSIRMTTFALGSFTLAVPVAHQSDRELIIQRCQPLVEDFDLLEPFSRIREAIQEAQRTAA